MFAEIIPRKMVKGDLKMFEQIRKNHEKQNMLLRILDDHDPIDHQILQLIKTNDISFDIIPIEKPKKNRYNNQT